MVLPIRTVLVAASLAAGLAATALRRRQRRRGSGTGTGTGKHAAAVVDVYAATGLTPTPSEELSTKPPPPPLVVRRSSALGGAVAALLPSASAAPHGATAAATAAALPAVMALSGLACLLAAASGGSGGGGAAARWLLALDLTAAAALAGALAVLLELLRRAVLLPLLQRRRAAAALADADADATVLVDDDGGGGALEPPLSPRALAKRLEPLNGTWVKDASLSQSLEPAMKLVRMSGMVRTAARLIKGVALRIDAPGEHAHHHHRHHQQQRRSSAGGGAQGQNGQGQNGQGGQDLNPNHHQQHHHDDEFRHLPTFSFGVFSVISWFRITERYALGGGASSHRRRDFRRGGSVGSARATARGTVVLEYAWNEPHAGRGVDEFSVDAEGRLNVAATITVGGETASYLQVYHRKK